VTQRDLFDARPETEYEKIRFVSAGAGSGKTYRLTVELERALTERGIDPSRVIATTFTVKAASELSDRVRARLIAAGHTELAEQTADALIGTVHSVCERLLRRFAFELKLSPALEVVAIEDATRLFDESLDRALSQRRARAMNAVAERLDIDDWEAHVRAVSELARANDVPPDALAGMGLRNADELLARFPAPLAADLDKPFFTAVKAAADGIAPGSKVTTEYRDEVLATLHALRRRRCTWRRWAVLATMAAGKRDGGEVFAAAVRAAARDYAAHKHLHRDVRDYLREVFAIAAAALADFQSVKRERRLIDFTDMEQLTLRALDVPAVAERLAEEVELLLVDEFQDTNPMQLALFMKLAGFAREVVFVGDVKQAIYAFRGTDPELVFATLANLSARAARTSRLTESHRARPGLVAYTNALFAKAFAPDGIARADVELAPVRADETRASCVDLWRLDGETDAQRRALANAIAALVAERYPIVDPDTRAVRPVGFGDVAVLARTNAQVEALARALRDARVPMKMTVTGLLATPEIVLARACLRRLNDASDTLASAEIIALTRGGEPEEWLADRLGALARGEDALAWAETTDPILAKLAALRARIATESPVEIVARVLNYVDIRAHVTAWGIDAVKAAQRQRNLDAFLDLAVQYESHCAAQHDPASLTGFLFWIEHPVSPELDLQPVVTTGDAVHVLTYHAAKGLEWPVVVASDLHYRPKPRLWDVRVESLAPGVDLADPLRDRFIRFWPYPFGRKTNGVPVREAIAASAAGARALAAGLAEERRLAYVGFTRARDLLVLAWPTRTPFDDAWCHAFLAPELMPSGDSLAVAGATVATRAIDAPAEPAPIATRAFAPRWFIERAPLPAPLEELVSPSSAAALSTARIARIVELGPRIDVSGADMNAVGTALHRIIAAELTNPGRQTLADAGAQLAAFDLAQRVSAQSALDVARRFARFVATLAPRATRAEHPVSHALGDGRWVRGRIDALVETDSGLVVIDHKSSPLPRSAWPDEVVAHAGQLAAYRDALEATDARVASTWIHFAVSGAVVEVALE